MIPFARNMEDYRTEIVVDSITTLKTKMVKLYAETAIKKWSLVVIIVIIKANRNLCVVCNKRYIKMYCLLGRSVATKLLTTSNVRYTY